jgi:hypothetical protein
VTAAKRQSLSRPWWLLPLGHFDPRWWWAIGTVLVAVDYVVGPDTQFPVIYAVPVILAAWYSGRSAGLTLALVLPLVHVLFVAGLWRPEHWAAIVATTAVRGAVVMLVGLWFGRLASHEAAVRRHVESLEGLLPICMFCKSIKNDVGEWEPLEPYLSKRSDTKFSHCFCPTCQRTQYPDLFNNAASTASSLPGSRS